MRHSPFLYPKEKTSPGQLGAAPGRLIVTTTVFNPESVTILPSLEQFDGLFSAVPKENPPLAFRK